MNSIVDC